MCVNVCVRVCVHYRVRWRLMKSITSRSNCEFAACMHERAVCVSVCVCVRRKEHRASRREGGGEEEGNRRGEEG